MYFWGNILPTSVSLAPWLIIVTRDSSYQVEVCTTVPVIILHSGLVAFLQWSAGRYAIIAPNSLRNRSVCHIWVYLVADDITIQDWTHLDFWRFCISWFQCLCMIIQKRSLLSLLLTSYAWITFQSLRLEYVHNSCLEPRCVSPPQISKVTRKGHGYLQAWQ